MGSALDLGAEEEFHLVDLETWRLSARAPEVLAALGDPHFSAELQRTTVETNTDVVPDLAGLRAQLVARRARLIDAAGTIGAAVAAVGTAPRSEFTDFELTATGRFTRMQQQYRQLVDEHLICGFQVHVGIADRDLAVEIAQRIERDLPNLLALAASSPYWHGEDTGYASFRTIVWQRWPSAAATGPLHSAVEYDRLVDDLLAAGVIDDTKMAYFDVRPSAHAPTLELRVADGCPLVDDAVLVAALYRAAARTAELAIERGEPYERRLVPLHRAAMWRAARSGISGHLLDDGVRPQPLPATDAIERMLSRFRPALEEFGDWDETRHLLSALLARGNSADRQRAAFTASAGDLDAVMRSVVDETHAAIGPGGGDG